MSWLHYLIEANTYLLVFYLCYRLLLDNSTHYTLNRIYLISSCLLAFFIPFTQVSILKPATDAVTQVVTQTSYVLPANIKVNQPADTSFQLSADELIPYLYISGAITAAVILIVRLMRLFSITRSGKSLKHGNYQRIDLPHSQTAFSFFNYLYIGTDLKQPETIIAHELVHIRQKHTLDILFLELLKIINWFSPVVYMVQQSLKTVHEYIADEQTAAHESDALAYSSFLLNNAYGLPGASVTQSFFNDNLLKRRIIMLNQQRSGKLARLKYLAAVPLCAGMLCASTVLFSKDYGVIDIVPAKKNAAIKADSAAYGLKMTDSKDDQFIVGDVIEFTDKTGRKTVYSVKTFGDKPLIIKKTDRTITIEKVLRDTINKAKAQTQQLPPPPPPIAPVKTVFSNFTEYLRANIIYPEKAIKNKGIAGMMLSFNVNTTGNITNATVAGKPGSELNAALKNAVDGFKGRVKAKPGAYKLGVNFIVPGSYDVKFPEPTVTKSANYIGEINIIGLTDAQHKMLKTPPPPPPAPKMGKNIPPPPPPIEPRKNSKITPPPPPPAITSIKWNNANQDKSLQAFYTHLSKSVNYPAVALKSNTKGRVILTFDVKDKKMSNIKVVRGVIPVIDNEIVKAMGNFDKPLDLKDAKYSIPVLFAITEDSTDPDVKKEYPSTGYELMKGTTTTILNEMVILGHKN